MAQFAGELPKNDLREALPHLRRPFTVEAVRFKVQKTWTTNGGGAMIVAYVDARLASDRLNMVVAEHWEDSYEDVRPGIERCHLKVFGVTRTDVGEAAGMAQAKALDSDSLKRAAVKFGVGVSVYAVPKLMLRATEGLRKIERQGKPDTYTLNDDGEKLARKRYKEWLTARGIGVFGDPLDHGDTLGSQGDYEIEPEGDERWGLAASAASANIEPVGLTPSQRVALAERLRVVPTQTQRLALVAAGVDHHSELSQATLPVFMDATKVLP